MIPAGWVLVPRKPTERMLEEFSGMYWPRKERGEWTRRQRELREREERAYLAMILAVPSAPTEEVSAIEALQAIIKSQRKHIKELKHELSQAISRQGVATHRHAPGREETGVQVGAPGGPARAVRAGVHAAVAEEPGTRGQYPDEAEQPAGGGL